MPRTRKYGLGEWDPGSVRLSDKDTVEMYKHSQVSDSLPFFDLVVLACRNFRLRRQGIPVLETVDMFRKRPTDLVEADYHCTRKRLERHQVCTNRIVREYRREKALYDQVLAEDARAEAFLMPVADSAARSVGVDPERFNSVTTREEALQLRKRLSKNVAWRRVFEARDRSKEAFRKLAPYQERWIAEGGNEIPHPYGGSGMCRRSALR